MALAIDASTPAVASTNALSTITTASFTPPSGSLLLVRWAGDSNGGVNPSAPSITDSLGVPLTYTLLDWQSRADSPTVNGQAACWWAVVGTSAAMTVSVTNGAGVAGNAVHVTVITGQNVNPIGAHGKSGSGSAGTIAQNYTAQANSGWGFIGDCDWDDKGAQTAGTGCTLTNGGSASIPGIITYGFIRRTSADDVNGGSNTLNVTLPTTSTNLAWVYAEVLPVAVADSAVQSTSRHPGRGPSTARFYQTPRPTSTSNIVTIDGSLTVTANRTATVAVTHVVSGSLTVTANRSATVAVTHTIGGSLTVTANRSATVAVTHTIGGSRPTTVNRTATIAVTHTIGGSLVVTASRTATVAVTHTIGGSRPTTVNRTATVAVTHTISGSRPITVGLAATADVPGVVTIGGSLVVTASRTATVAVVHTVSGSLIVVVTRSATAGTSQRAYLFLPFFG